MNGGEFQPDFTREAGELETSHLFTGGQEVTESEETGPDGKVYKVTRHRNATGGFIETRREISDKKLQVSSAGDGGSVPPENIYKETISGQDDKKIPPIQRFDNTMEKDSFSH